MHWSRDQLEQKLGALGKGLRTLVLTHDFPDPDALASAAGLARLLEVTRRHEVTIAYGGFIGRAENREMVTLLDIPVVPVESLDLSSFAVVALVDTQPQTGNNALPAQRLPNIVVDHHPLRETCKGVSWLDVRHDVGACATIVMEYLRLTGIPIGAKLATALYYAVKTETQDLVREAHPADVDAYRYIFPLVDRELLRGILNPPVPAEYFRLLSRAVERSRVFGPLLVVDLQNVPFPEIVAEVADLMLRHEGIRWVLSFGQLGDSLYLSMRTREQDVSAGEILQKVVAKDGRAGGHGMMAGGRIPVDDIAGVRAAVQNVTARLRDVLDLEDTPERSI